MDRLDTQRARIAARRSSPDATAGELTVTPLDQARGQRTAGPGGLVTIKQVGDACGLPHPVIMQLVPRTWTEAGWVYTAEQLRATVTVADHLRQGSQ